MRTNLVGAIIGTRSTTRDETFLVSSSPFWRRLFDLRWGCMWFKRLWRGWSIRIRASKNAEIRDEITEWAAGFWGLAEGSMKATACCKMVVSGEVDCERNKTYWVWKRREELLVRCYRWRVVWARCCRDTSADGKWDGNRSGSSCQRRERIREDV